MVSAVRHYTVLSGRKLNGVDPERYLHLCNFDVIADWPELVGALLPWRVTLPA